jgi:SAM-dependent methyltransferase
MGDRYWWDNSLADERDRLRLLERIGDPRSIGLLTEAGVDTGWRCAELGAGAGSVVAWLADRVGPTGSVLAVDRDVTLLDDVAERSNVELVPSSLEDLEFEPGSLDLVHSRNTLMHVDTADRVIKNMVNALRPGGVLVLEEADYYSLAGVTSDVLARVAAPLAGGWTWARTMPSTHARLQVVDLSVVLDAPMLRGDRSRRHSGRTPFGLPKRGWLRRLRRLPTASAIP